MFTGERVCNAPGTCFVADWGVWLYLSAKSRTACSQKMLGRWAEERAARGMFEYSAVYALCQSIFLINVRDRDIGDGMLIGVEGLQGLGEVFLGVFSGNAPNAVGSVVVDVVDDGLSV